MADLVADHRADRAEVLGGVGIGVEERRLQDRGREGDVVDYRVVERVDGLRAGHPLVAVGWLADLAQLVIVFKGGTAAHVLHQVVGEFQAFVAAPLVWVADLGVELGKLLRGLLFGFLAHPGEVGDAGAVGVDKVLHQLQHLLLGLRREVALDVFAPDVLTDQGFCQCDAALPTVALLGRAGKLLAVELEVCPSDLLAEHAGAGTQNVPRGPQLPVRQGFAAQHRVEVSGVGGHHVDDAAVGEAGGAKHLLHQRRHVGEFGRVVGGDRVARLHHIPVGVCQRLLHVDNALCGDLRAQPQQVLRGEELEHARDVLLIVSERLCVLFLVVVGLVGKPKPRLHEVRDGILALGILLHPVGQRCANACALQEP